MAAAPPPPDSALDARLRLAGGALAAVCLLGAMTLLIASAQLGPPTALTLIKILTYLLGCGIPLAVVSLAVTSFGAGSVVRRRCRGLPGVRFSRTVFGTVYRGEWQQDGHEVHVFRDRVRLRVDAPTAAFTRADLRRLFRDDSPGPYAVARSSARHLVWAGVRTLRVKEGWLELRGPLLGSMSELLGHALGQDEPRIGKAEALVRTHVDVHGVLRGDPPLIHRTSWKCDERVFQAATMSASRSMNQTAARMPMA